MRINNCCFNLGETKKACWIIENRCNLDCVFCFLNNMSAVETFNPHYIDDIISSLIELEISHVIISGGEPLLSPYLFEIIGKLEKANMTISICTNGMLADIDFCERLSYTSVKRLTVNIANLSPAIFSSKTIENETIQAIKNMVLRGFEITTNDILRNDMTENELNNKIFWALESKIAQFSLTVPVCKYTLNHKYHTENNKINEVIEYIQKIESLYVGKLDILLNNPMCMSDECPANSKIFGIYGNEINTCLVKGFQQSKRSQCNIEEVGID